MNNSASSTPKEEEPETSCPPETTLNTGSRDSENKKSSVAGVVQGNVTTDNTKIVLNIEHAHFTDPVAAWSTYIERPRMFGNDFGFLSLGDSDYEITQSTESMPQISPSDVQQQSASIVTVPTKDTHDATVLTTHTKRKWSDMDISDSPTDEMLHKMILNDKGEENEEYKTITDDELYEMVIEFKHESTDRAQELNIHFMDKKVGTVSDEGGVNQASRSETLYHYYKIDLTGIESPTVRIVTKENVSKTVDIARYKPEDTRKVTLYLENIFHETHFQKNVQSESECRGNLSAVDRVNYIRRRRVHEVDGQKNDPFTVTIDLSDINYEGGYVFMKTRHNVEIIVKVAEKDPSKTKGISQFLTKQLLE